MTVAQMLEKLHNGRVIRGGHSVANILIIDDDEVFCEMLSRAVGRIGHKVQCVHELEAGFRMATSNTFDVVYLDVHLPDGNGLEMLPKIQEAKSKPEVIIITGAGDPDGAALAIESGAWDYIAKPASLEAMRLPLVRALDYRKQKQSTKKLVAVDHKNIIGEAPCMRQCYDLLAQAAGSDTNVLITGETGTGKELFAVAIHENSSRSKGNFVVVDCAALPDSLIESLLLGHRKGAFTGADANRSGLIAQADGGTLFLDEVGELPFSLQKAFLRVLQERRFRPIGGVNEINSDFRLVAATNRPLEEMVKSGEFRQDLLFRLRSFTIDLPPLRDRKEDITAIAMNHVSTLCSRYNVVTKGFSPEFFDALASWDWPGNVRELIQTVEGIFAVAGNDEILFPKHLPTQLRIQLTRAALSVDKATEKSVALPSTTTQSFQTLRETRESAIAQAEQRYLEDLMAFTHGDIKEVCRISGLARSQLYSLLKKYDIPRTR
jgi:two-component system, NtrC family, response regulator